MPHSYRWRTICVRVIKKAPVNAAASKLQRCFGGARMLMRPRGSHMLITNEARGKDVFGVTLIEWFVHYILTPDPKTTECWKFDVFELPLPKKRWRQPPRNGGWHIFSQLPQYGYQMRGLISSLFVGQQIEKLVEHVEVWVGKRMECLDHAGLKELHSSIMIKLGTRDFHNLPP